MALLFTQPKNGGLGAVSILNITKLRRTDHETGSLPYRIPGCRATLRDSVNKCLYHDGGFFVTI